MAAAVQTAQPGGVPMAPAVQTAQPGGVPVAAAVQTARAQCGVSVHTLMCTLAALFPLMCCLASFILCRVPSLYCSSSCCRLICMGRPVM